MDLYDCLCQYLSTLNTILVWSFCRQLRTAVKAFRYFWKVVPLGLIQKIIIKIISTCHCTTCIFVFGCKLIYHHIVRSFVRLVFWFLFVSWMVSSVRNLEDKYYSSYNLQAQIIYYQNNFYDKTLQN